MKDLRDRLLTCVALCLLSLSVFAQTVGFREGDRVETPDARQGIVESFKMPDMAKVKFDDGTTKFYIRADLKKIEPPKAVGNEPPENFRVGDAVVDPRTPERKYKIYSISGDSAVIFQDIGKYAMNTAMTIKLSDIVSLKTWERRQNEEKEQKLLRAALEDEAEPFLITVEKLAHAYDEKYRGGPIRYNAATWEKWRQELESLDAICRKYPNLTNPELPEYRKRDPFIRENPADWCKMAAQRTDVLNKMRGAFGEYQAKNDIAGVLLNQIRGALRDRRGWVKDELQPLIFDRAAWEQKNLQSLRENLGATGAKRASDLLKPLYAQADELKAKIEQDVATRSWTQPAYKDAALEAQVKAAYPKQFSGVRVLKTGMTYATWKAYDDTSLVGTTSEYNIYRIERDKYRIKEGLALVQMPNQPLCQIRSFTFEQVRTGASFGAAQLLGIGRGGIFVKCP